MTVPERPLPDFSSMTLHTVPGYQAIVDLVRREISLGRLQTGDRLPPERRLAAQLGVARETVRQALRVLEGSGEVSITRGATGGPVVRESALDAQSVRAELAGRIADIEELNDYRSMIEGAAAAVAAARRDEHDLRRLDTAQDRLRAATTLAESRAADTEFHLALAAATGNRLLVQSVEDARARMFTPIDVLTFEFVKDSSVRAHDRILQAVRDGRPADATAAMHHHLENTRAELDRVVAEQQPD